MPVNDFDRGLIEKFEGHDFAYNPAGWERLAQQLPEVPEGRRKRVLWLPLTGIAAAVALAISIPFLWNRNAQQDHTVAKAVRSSNTPITRSVTPPPVTAPLEPKVDVPDDASAQQQPVMTPAASAVSFPVSVQPQIQQPIAANNTLPVLPNITSGQANLPVSTMPVNPIVDVPELTMNPGMSLPVAPPKEYTITAVPNAPAPVVQQTPVVVKQEVDLSRKQDHYLTIDPDETSYAGQPQKKLKISLAGGYNQGTTNSGYMVGFNTRKNLGRKIYVEGDVAFTSNRNTEPTQSLPSAEYQTLRVASPQNLANAKGTANAEPVKQLYYLQVTPVVGYQVLKNWSIGAGADVQRLFRDGDREAYTINESKEIKAMPTMDVGLVGKTEYSVFKNIKAGLQYRMGMSDVIEPGKDYTNRSYLQVQLKVGILGNK